MEAILVFLLRGQINTKSTKRGQSFFMGRGVVANIMNSKNILFGVITIGALFFKASANDIEPGKQYYTAIKATQPIVLD
jgi:threonine/homoserine/homoserine lactone efflux protein